MTRTQIIDQFRPPCYHERKSLGQPRRSELIERDSQGGARDAFGKAPSKKKETVQPRGQQPLDKSRCSAPPSATSGHRREKVDAQAGGGRQVDYPTSGRFWRDVALEQLIGGPSAKLVLTVDLTERQRRCAGPSVKLIWLATAFRDCIFAISLTFGAPRAVVRTCARLSHSSRHI